MKWLKIIGIISALLIIIGAGIVITMPYWIELELDNRISAIQTKGDPICGKDLIPHVPDDRNGAPIYERVFAMINPSKKDIIKAFAVVQPLKRKEHPELLALAKELAIKYQGVLPLIEQATSRPQCRFNTNWNDPPEKIVFPCYAKAKNTSKLLLEISIADASEGKIDDAVKAVELNYKTSEVLREEPVFIGHLVRYACIAIASQGLKQSAQYGDISEPQALRLFNLLGKIDLQADYVYAMKGERAQGLDIMERVRHHCLDISGVYSSNTKRNQCDNPHGLMLMDLRACADELFYLKYMDKIIAAAGKPYRSAISRQMERDPDFPMYALMSSIVLPCFSKNKAHLYKAMATVTGDRAFLAVLAYKAKFGVYPSNLSDVETKLGLKLPLDPWIDEPLHYRKENNGFVLYSVGENMKDDNARTVEDPSSIRTHAKGSTEDSKFLDNYPYTNGDGRHSADMIWQMSR